MAMRNFYRNGEWLNYSYPQFYFNFICAWLLPLIACCEPVCRISDAYDKLSS